MLNFQNFWTHEQKEMTYRCGLCKFATNDKTLYDDHSVSDNHLAIAKEKQDKCNAHCRAQQKQWYENHKEEKLQYCKEYNKEHYEENKGRINVRRAKKITCVCGSVYRAETKSRHEITEKHLSFIKKTVAK